MTKRNGFQWLSGDLNWTDCGGRWYRKTGDTTYEVVEFTPWEERDSSAVDVYGKYNVQLAEVDVAAHGGYTGGGPTMADRSDLENALAFVGLRLQSSGELWTYGGDVIEAAYAPLAMVEALFSYGAKDVVSDDSGSNAYALLRAVGVYRPNAHLRQR